jgi:7-carboxy-7-deazaguanine synthase
MHAVVASRTDRRRGVRAALPVVEIFGPTVQGEGPEAGVPAYFVRFGGCDFRCAWCDSMHAVDPARVRAEAEHLTVEEIVRRIHDLPDGPALVVLSGGNPALFDLQDLVRTLQQAGLRVAVETQGSRWQGWLAGADRLVVSPKPPSSGMVNTKNQLALASFMTALEGVLSDIAVLKVVVFDEHDLEWAAQLHLDYPRLPFYLSAGTDLGLDDEQTLVSLRERYRWLCETVAHRPDLSHARVLPQLHVIAWGTAIGV